MLGRRSRSDVIRRLKIVDDGECFKGKSRVVTKTEREEKEVKRRQSGVLSKEQRLPLEQQRRRRRPASQE